jgi:hypothetical protein
VNNIRRDQAEKGIEEDFACRFEGNDVFAKKGAWLVFSTTCQAPFGRSAKPMLCRLS